MINKKCIDWECEVREEEEDKGKEEDVRLCMSRIVIYSVSYLKFLLSFLSHLTLTILVILFFLVSICFYLTIYLTSHLRSESCFMQERVEAFFGSPQVFDPAGRPHHVGFLISYVVFI